MEPCYRIYDIIDRISDELYRLYPSLNKASKAFGRHQSYFASALTPGKSISVQTLREIAKFTDIDMNYLYSGGRRLHYHPIAITYKNIIRTWDEIPYGEKQNRNMSLYINRLNHHFPSMRLSTLILFADKLKQDGVWLLQG